MAFLNIIVAYNQKNVIGKDNGMPWRLPADLAHFKKITMGSPIIMGRKTRESLGRSLPGRLNIAISRDAHYHAEGTQVVSSLAQAIALANTANTDAIFVIGGGQIYKEALPLANTVYATEIYADMEGDTFFPVLDKKQWQEISRLSQAPQHNLNFDFVVYQKLPGAIL